MQDIIDSFSINSFSINSFSTNPFSSRFWQAGAFPFIFENGITVETLFRHILSNRLSQIAGPHGSGKSTLLQSIAELAKQNGSAVHFAFLNREQRQLPADFLSGIISGGGNSLFLLDGYEQLPFYKQILLCRQFWNKAAHLVWTTHSPAWFVPVLYRTVPHFECFRQLTDKLLKEQNMKIDEVYLREVFTESGGNFRDAFMQLYDTVENDYFGRDE